MSGCCDPRGCDKMFGRGFARRMAKRYRRRGLDRNAERLVDYLESRPGGLAGATVLEIGGGVGEVGLELLRRGAASVTVAELSPAYDEEAARLAAAAGVTGRVDRRIVDVAVTPEGVDRADLVVLHRVVCCYPDYERLLSAAAERCADRLAFSHPPRNVGSRGFIALQNAVLALARRQYRTFVHPPAAMLEVLRQRGLRPEMQYAGRLWQVEGLVR